MTKVDWFSWYQSDYMHQSLINNLNQWFLNKSCQDCLDLQNTFTTRFSPYRNKSLRQHHYFSCNRGVLLHRNGDLVAICVSIATQNLSCIIYLFGCNMLTLMHPFLGFPLHLVGNNATPILCCISIPYVATESCYSHHTRDGCF
jgi:hypothetical protein